MIIGLLSAGCWMRAAAPSQERNLSAAILGLGGMLCREDGHAWRKKWRGGIGTACSSVCGSKYLGNGTATVSRLPPIPASISISSQALNSSIDSRCRKPGVAAQLLLRTIKMEVEERYSSPCYSRDRDLFPLLIKSAVDGPNHYPRHCHIRGHAICR